MQKSLITSLCLSALLAISPFQHARVQAQTTNPVSVIPWFAVKNNTMVVQTGDKAKTLDKDVTLPNGIRVEHLTRSIVLTNGNRVKLKEGDMLSLNGEFIQKNIAPQPEVATGTAPAILSASVAPAAAAPMPVPASVPTATPGFTYRPTAPVDGKLKGVVELGASGFNMFIVRIDNKHNWKTEQVEYGNSLVMENMATESDIRTGLKAYIGKMLDFGVDGRDIHFVVSSGALLAQVTGRIIKALNSLHYIVNTVTPEQEGIFSLKSVLPPSYITKAFVVDIGSGNTKISWLEHGLPKSLHTYGAKYFEKNVDSTAVSTDVQAIARQVPEERHGTCFIIGGAPFDMAKIVRQGKERYTVLRPPAGYADQRAAKIKAGVNIYNAVATTTNTPQFVFDWDANFTIGYLLSLP